MIPMLKRQPLLAALNSSTFPGVNSKVKLNLTHLCFNYLFLETEFLDTLYNLTKDHDALVVINAIEAINEILSEKGGIEVTRGLVINLLNRIKDFNEWG